MLERVEDLTGVPRRALWGGTFHSIAQRILRVHGDLVGLKRNYTILDQGEAESILKSVIQATDGKFIKTKNNPKPKVIADPISYARNTCRPPREEADNRYPFLEGMASNLCQIRVKFKFAFSLIVILTNFFATLVLALNLKISSFQLITNIDMS